MDFDKELLNILSNSFGNVSKSSDFVSSNGSQIISDENYSLETPVKIGVMTGLIFIWFAECKILPSKVINYAQSKVKNAILLVSLLLICSLIVPLMLICLIYRKTIEILLRISMRDQFAGLLDGTDSLWAVEESSALSVINILGVLEVNSSSDDNLLERFRYLIKDRLICNLNFKKLTYLREQKYGYYYWKENSSINLKEHIKWLDVDHKKCIGITRNCDNIYSSSFKNLINELTNEKLPRNHTTNWEIFIGKSCPYEMKRNLKRKCVPILFRVHHSLGDGVALLRLLLEAVADSKTMKEKSGVLYKNIPSIKIIPVPDEDSACTTFEESSNVIYYSNDLLGASMPFFKLGFVFEILHKYINSSVKLIKSTEIISPMLLLLYRCTEIFQSFSKNVYTALLIPACLLQQTIRSMDENALHGSQLTGDKLVSYWMEENFKDNEKYGVFNKIQDIKNLTGTRFCDVVLSALSASLTKYFQQIGNVPKDLTVVIPKRMDILSHKLALKNGFSVGLLPLCISQVNGEDKKLSEDDSSLLERLKDISGCSEKLRNDPDYLINFWVMKWLSAVLPIPILRPLLQSNSTLVFSNLPGPQTVSIMGHPLKNIVFWIPNRGTTGLGCSFLTYNGNVRLSLMADRALISNQMILDEIIKDIVNNIHQFHHLILRKKLHPHLRKQDSECRINPSKIHLIKSF